MQSLLRERTYGRMTRAQEERMRSENRRREYLMEDQKKMVSQDKILKYEIDLYRACNTLI